MTARKRIAALGGEGIGTEVVDVTCEILVGADMPVDILTPAHGEPAIKSHGHPVPDETKKICEAADGVLFGAAGAPPTSAVVQWLRWEKGVTASVRPVKHYPGAYSPLARPDGRCSYSTPSPAATRSGSTPAWDGRASAWCPPMR